MLAPGQEKCPSCGTRLRAQRPVQRGAGVQPNFDTRDIFWLTMYIVGIALIPILLVVAVGMICVLVGR
jgi:hypothetical protein